MITKTRVSVLAMLVLAGLSIAYILNVGLHIASPGARHASMTVPDTNGLLVGSRVLLRGIEIGHVTDISQSTSGAVITWDYPDSDHIPLNSTFRVDNLSALGEAYVAVLPNSAAGPYLQNNARIDPQQVTVPTTFKELSQRLTDILNQVDPQEVQRVFGELNTGLPEGQEVIGSLNRAGRLFADEFTQQSDAMVSLLSTLQPLIMRTGPIPDLLRQTTPLMNGFGVGFEGLLASVRDAVVLGGPLYDGVKYGASPLFGELQKFLDVNSANLNVIGVNLLPAARAGAASLRTVDLGRVLDQMLASTQPNGALTIHVPAGGGR
ncbi:MlaD family protein [Gordonia polyisoprenivorans]|uniref:MlaD family protein n=1 Tax=Gordonia polyisoprenivorans TaxID=84595 RepID=UPI0003622DE0|nr:MlaD family protein [Gordonia polyisoprenivorans]OZC29608.1 MCE family protein [Gordonia polyisoprenivorans]QTI70875.1 MCE family protein [Gordonia polyisoprenivorans]